METAVFRRGGLGMALWTIFTYGTNITANDLNVKLQDVMSYNIYSHIHDGNIAPKIWADFASLVENGTSLDAANAANQSILDHVRDRSIHRDPDSSTDTNLPAQNNMGFWVIKPTDWVWKNYYWETHISLGGLYNDSDYLVNFQPVSGEFTSFFSDLNSTANFFTLQGVVPLQSKLLNYNIYAYNLSSDGFDVRLQYIGTGARYSVTGRSEQTFMRQKWSGVDTYDARLMRPGQIQAIDDRLYVASRANQTVCVFSTVSGNLIEAFAPPRIESILDFGLNGIDYWDENGIFHQGDGRIIKFIDITGIAVQKYKSGSGTIRYSLLVNYSFLIANKSDFSTPEIHYLSFIFDEPGGSGVVKCSTGDHGNTNDAGANTPYDGTVVYGGKNVDKADKSVLGLYIDGGDKNMLRVPAILQPDYENLNNNDYKTVAWRAPTNLGSSQTNLGSSQITSVDSLVVPWIDSGFTYLLTNDKYYNRAFRARAMRLQGSYKNTTIAVNEDTPHGEYDNKFWNSNDVTNTFLAGNFTYFYNSYTSVEMGQSLLEKLLFYCCGGYQTLSCYWFDAVDQRQWLGGDLYTYPRYKVAATDADAFAEIDHEDSNQFFNVTAASANGKTFVHYLDGKWKLGVVPVADPPLTDPAVAGADITGGTPIDICTCTVPSDMKTLISADPNFTNFYGDLSFVLCKDATTLGNVIQIYQHAAVTGTEEDPYWSSIPLMPPPDSYGKIAGFLPPNTVIPPNTIDEITQVIMNMDGIPDVNPFQYLPANETNNAHLQYWTYVLDPRYPYYLFSLDKSGPLILTDATDFIPNTSDGRRATVTEMRYYPSYPDPSSGLINPLNLPPIKALVISVTDVSATLPINIGSDIALYSLASDGMLNKPIKINASVDTTDIMKATNFTDVTENPLANPIVSIFQKGILDKYEQCALTNIHAGLVVHDTLVGTSFEHIHRFIVYLTDEYNNVVHAYRTVESWESAGALDKMLTRWEYDTSFRKGEIKGFLAAEGSDGSYFGDVDAFPDEVMLNPLLISDANDKEVWYTELSSRWYGIKHGFGVWQSDMHRKAKYNILSDVLIESDDYRNGGDTMKNVGFLVLTKPVAYENRETVGDTFTVDPRYVEQVYVQNEDVPVGGTENYLAYTPKMVYNAYTLMNKYNKLNSYCNSFALLNDNTIDYIDLMFDFGQKLKLPVKMEYNLSGSIGNNINEYLGRRYKIGSDDYLYGIAQFDDMYSFNLTSKIGTIIGNAESNYKLDNMRLAICLPPDHNFLELLPQYTSNVQNYDGLNWVVFNSRGQIVGSDDLPGAWFSISESWFMPENSTLVPSAQNAQFVKQLRLTLKQPFKDLIGSSRGLHGLQHGASIPFTPSFRMDQLRYPIISNPDNVGTEPFGSAVSDIGALNDNNTYFSSTNTLTLETAKFYNTAKLYSPILSRGGLWFGIFAPPVRYLPRYISKSVLGNNENLGWMCGDYPPHYFAAISEDDALLETDTVNIAQTYTCILGTHKTNVMLNNFRYYKILRHIGVGRL